MTGWCDTSDGSRCRVLVAPKLSVEERIGVKDDADVREANTTKEVV